MTNQSLTTALVVICSLGGWYVVLNKYLELKAMVKNMRKRLKTQQIEEIIVPVADINDEEEYDDLDDFDIYTGEHIPGMGPPPITNMPFAVPDELVRPSSRAERVAERRKAQDMASMTKATIVNPSTNKPSPINTAEKRLICNWACIMHLAGFGFLTGIPFVNILLPSVLWLLKKEQHNYLAKQGREVINFQITFTLLQFICLGLGSLFVWFAPLTAGAIFHWTNTMRVIFSTSMYLPFNLFTVVPFFWACIVTLRGAVAAYHGLTYKYPLAQPFLFASQPTDNQQPNAQSAKEPQPAYAGSNPGGLGNISFG